MKIVFLYNHCPMTQKTKKDLHIPFTWEERRPVYLDRLFYIPKVYDHASDAKIDWTSSEIFGNNNPISMEICSGNGQWVGAKALANPERNWVAVEMCFERARTIWLKVHRQKIPNLYVICAEASAFIKYYVTEKSVEEAYVNFPDPWPKRCHAKHRLLWAPFLQSLETVVSGKVTLATDDEPYHNQMVEEFAKSGVWTPKEFDPSKKETYGDSFFADLWIAKGRSLHYLQYEAKVNAEVVCGHC
jgi:tRNA (guanine-N7-)-methyltransferase